MALAPVSPPLHLEVGTTYHRLCDASAVAFLDDHTFVAASDEARPDGENRLQIYRVGTPEPIDHLDLNDYLQPKGNKPEADIESAARIGDVVYWMTSHGRNSEGKERPNRQRFFATRLKNGHLQPVGVAYTELLDDLTKHNAQLEAAQESGAAPEKGGVSIEGLCQGQGKTLWIGFRSPLLHSRALCGEISNPAQALTSQRLRLGDFWTLDLGGRGIRDWLKYGDRWLILAGTSGDGDNFALYEWNGNRESAPHPLGDLTRSLKAIGLDGMHPEGLTVAGNGDLWLMADDGDLALPDGTNKYLPESERTFRSVRLVLGKNQVSTR